MEETIVVKESKKTIRETLCIYVIIWIFIGMLLLFAFLNGEVLDFSFFLFLFISTGWTFLLAGCVVASYCFRRLELSYKGCFYRTMFGRKRFFLPQDVAKVKTKPSPWGDGDLLLIGHDNQVIAKMEMNMSGTEKVIPFFEIYNLSAVWTEKGWVHPEPVKINSVEDELVVRPNGFSLNLLLFFAIAYVLFIVWVFGWVLERDAYSHILAIILGGMSIVLLVSFAGEIRTRKNLCLVLTPGICSFTDKSGRKRQFYLEDITRVVKTEERIVKRSKVLILRLWLSNGDLAAEVAFTAAMENVADIIPFVEHHQIKNHEETIETKNVQENTSDS